MEEISLKGKKYLKAKLIARELGYTNDYIGQLCRAGKVDAELVGRTWYVDPDSVKNHKQARYRSNKASTKRGLKLDVLKTLMAEQGEQKEHFYDHRSHQRQINIRYETDDATLMPVTRKETEISDQQQSEPVELPVKLADAKQLDIDNKTNKQYHFEAPKREETKFFGTLKVTDFITEVPVAGEEDEVQAVPVTGSERYKIKNKVHDETKSEMVKLRRDIQNSVVQSVTTSPTKNDVLGRKSVSVPVQTNNAVQKLSIAYRVATAFSFLVALFVSATLIGLEAKVTANSEVAQTKYTFSTSNISALIYLVK